MVPGLLCKDLRYINFRLFFSNEGGHWVKLRGLPFSCRVEDIFQFFQPLKPLNVEFLRGRDSRPSGECEVEFANEEDFNEALTYDQKFIGNRYIELFPLNKQPTGMVGNNKMNRSVSGGMGAGVNSGNAGIPSLFPAPSMSSPGASGGPNMTTAYPHQQMAAGVSGFSNNMGDLLMADMAKKMFQSAFNPFNPNQMFPNQSQNMFQQQPQQSHKFNNRRY